LSCRASLPGFQRCQRFVAVGERPHFDLFFVREIDGQGDPAGQHDGGGNLRGIRLIDLRVLLQQLGPCGLIAFHFLIDFRTRQSIVGGLRHRHRGDLAGRTARQGPRKRSRRRQPDDGAIGKNF
jgi:hypothetical protein